MQNQPTDTHELQCLEVWGGSSHADHSASVPGLDISVTARPYGDSEAGGDLYLISSCSSGWISRMLLADVAGHGDAVSDLSAKLRKAMHKSINTVDQSKLARTLNTAFDEISDGSKFATALLMTYFAPTGHLIFVNAGHPPPLLCRAGADQWIPIDQDTDGIMKQSSRDLRVGIKNLPLGVIGSTDYEQIAIKINEGDRICAYTDAYIEAQSPDGKLLGVDGLAQILAATYQSAATSNTQPDPTHEIQAQGYQLADDDHTMLLFHHNGQSRSKVGPSTLGKLIKNGFGFGHTDTVL
ncbi:hypothetical protein COB72_00695 [bacterium]|nr:MAG: hypothetical protein COB72_00695 [bacterium]